MLTLRSCFLLVIIVLCKNCVISKNMHCICIIIANIMCKFQEKFANTSEFGMQLCFGVRIGEGFGCSYLEELGILFCFLHCSAFGDFAKLHIYLIINMIAFPIYCFVSTTI